MLAVTVTDVVICNGEGSEGSFVPPWRHLVPALQTLRGGIPHSQSHPWGQLSPHPHLLGNDNVHPPPWWPQSCSPLLNPSLQRLPCVLPNMWPSPVPGFLLAQFRLRFFSLKNTGSRSHACYPLTASLTFCWPAPKPLLMAGRIALSSGRLALSLATSTASSGDGLLSGSCRDGLQGRALIGGGQPSSCVQSNCGRKHCLARALLVPVAGGQPRPGRVCWSGGPTRTLEAQLRDGKTPVLCRSEGTPWDFPGGCAH